MQNSQACVPQKESDFKKLKPQFQSFDKVLSTLTKEKMQAEYPMLVAYRKDLHRIFLIHWLMHLSYHLGR